jgi:hypothetical protein
MPGFLGGSSAVSGGTGGEILFPKEFIDPVTKLRVSQPENLIDTDFEYGLQPTKWETVELINNTPSFFSKSGDTTIDGIQSIITNNGTREITVKTGLDHGLAVGIPISVTGTRSVTADGSYIINSIPNPQTFTYLCKDNQIGDNSIEDLYTSIITGEFFQGSQIRVANAEGVTTDGEAISTLTVTTESTHGFGVNTPFYFLNLNSTISQEFEAANTAAKSFDSSNSATAQTFDGSNTLASFNIDWSNSATVGGTTSLVTTVSTANNTITVSHSTETFNGLPLGSPLYYDVTTSTGYFASNPRGVIFLKTISDLGPSQSTFQVSAAPDGEPIGIEASMNGTFQIANQARTFAGNNTDPLTQVEVNVEVGESFPFDGGNEGFAGTETNGLSQVLGFTADYILVSTASAAGLDYYVGAMVRYQTTGAAASGLVNNTTYFISSVTPSGTDLYQIVIKALPDSPSPLVPSGGSGTQTFRKIGVSVDKDIVHIRNSNFALKDMIEYTFPEDGRFTTESAEQTKIFYFVSKVYDAHNYELSESIFTPLIATGGTITSTQVLGRTYNVHTFTTVGTDTFAVSNPGSEPEVEYLIVAGGGSGGSRHAAGGGAGGFRTGTANVTATSYSIVVGAGGVSSFNPGTSNNFDGGDGGNSSAFSIVSNGGGGGGRGGSNGRPGGSGGGGGEVANTLGGAGTAGQGNAGGQGRSPGAYLGSGGGGGAGEVGQNARVTNPANSGGFGGRGEISSISGASVVYAGGGGGGSYGNSGSTDATTKNHGRGGAGGGGFGGTANGVAGTPNTGGGGGGGASNGDATGRGGNGGSGIVIVRYPITPPVPFTASTASGGTTTTYTENGVTYQTHSFTSTGASTFTISNIGSINEFDILLVGGGGGAGTYAGGGGGGEVVHIERRELTTGSYPISVGAGGVGTTGTYQTGLNGQSTTGFGETAKPGGGAKSSDDYDNPVSANGTYAVVANGGGGSSRSAGYFGTLGTTVGTSGRTTRYGGHRGGQVSSGGGSQNQGSNYPGGGGAGAGGSVNGDTAGFSSGNASGDGGPGALIKILQTPYYFGAGGGGGVYYNNSSPKAGNGGLGGGGGGGNDQPGQGGLGGLNPGQAGSTSGARNGGNAGANTGSGGGAGRGETGGRGGNGGSGIVIVRYPIAIAE